MAPPSIPDLDHRATTASCVRGAVGEPGVRHGERRTSTARASRGRPSVSGLIAAIAAAPATTPYYESFTAAFESFSLTDGVLSPEAPDRLR